VFDARQSSMRDLTSYAPIRVALTGIWRVIFGLLLGIPAGLFIWIGPNGEAGAPHNPGDMPAWWMFVVGLGLGVVALAFVAGGLGRLVCAFMRSCYFRAGAEGLAVRLPKQGWFGRFRLVEHQFRWEEIEQLIHHVSRLNLIPVASELHIRLFGGTEVIVERFYFSANTRRLREELLSEWARSGK